MEKHYTWFYALRELRARPRTFLPLFTIFFGVMLLMGNLLIYFQCELTSDLVYYKAETQLILPDLTDEEVMLLRQIQYVQQVEAVADDKNTYTCYVELTEDRNRHISLIEKSLVDVLHRLKLEERSEPYISFFRMYNDPELWKNPFEFTTLLNTGYMDALRDTMFNPGTITLSFIAAIMLFAAVILVYRMKIAQASKEYACLAGMGMSLSQLGKIQYLQGIFLLITAYVPSQLLAIATIKVVSILSYRIYPEFDGNQVLLFDIPWLTLGITFILYAAALFLGVFLCMRPYRKKNVSAILSGAADTIPFVEKSSVKFLSGGNFDGYGTVWKKRNRRHVWPIMGLFFCLILFPAFLFGGVLEGVTDLSKLPDTGSRVICRLHAYGHSGSERGIPYTLLQEIMEMAEIDTIKISLSTHRTGLTGTAGLPDEYAYTNTVHTAEAEHMCSYALATFLAKEVPAPGTIWVPLSFPGEIGDTVTLTRGNSKTQAVIGQKLEDLPAQEKYYDESIIDYTIVIGEDLYPSLCGTEQIRLDEEISIYSSVPDAQVEELLNRIAVLTGDTRAYLNDYDRRLHDKNERPYTMENSYYENRIWIIKNAFVTLFILSQTLYLMLCAVAVIGSTLHFQLYRRRGEYAVLRALGLMDEKLHQLSHSYVGNIFRWVIPILYPVMVLLLYMNDPEAGIHTNAVGEKYIGALHTLISGSITYAITCAILYLLYGGTSRFISQKSTNHILSQPLAEAIKERE